MTFSHSAGVALLTLSAGCTVNTTQARPSPPPQPTVANAAPAPANHAEHRQPAGFNDRNDGCEDKRPGDACSERGQAGRCSTERGRQLQCETGQSARPDHQR